MLYQTSCEEHKYLAGLRKEKDSFENLIKERGVSLFTVSILVLFTTDISSHSQCCSLSLRTNGPEQT